MKSVYGSRFTVVFAAFIYCALRITQKQKKMVEDKQEEILASIRYAKRIQDALLPTEKYIHKHLERLRAKMPARSLGGPG